MSRKPTGALDIAVVYVYPAGVPDYDDAARRFVDTYREFPPLADHTLHIIFNGDPPSAANTAVFAGVPCQFHEHDNTGWDIGAYRWAAREIECDMLVCLGGHSSFRRLGWLRRMADVFQERGDGLYGASASYWVTPHIRTAGFWCNPELIAAYPTEIRTYQDRYEFEHGERSITRLAEHLGLGCWMVTWDGVYAQAEWRTPPNVFWRGDQSNCLFYDRLHDLYDAQPLADPLLDALAGGWGVDQGARGLGRTKSEWLAQADSDPARAEELLTVSGSWTFLARELLNSLEQSADDEASRVRIQKEFVAMLCSSIMVGIRPGILHRTRVRDQDLKSPEMMQSAIRLALGLSGISGKPYDEQALLDLSTVHDGMQARRPQRIVKKLLQPFLDRQYDLDARNAALLALLADELKWLKARVEKLS